MNKREFINSLKGKIIDRIKKEGIHGLSKVLEEEKETYMQGVRSYGIKDSEQSWKPFKGKLLEEIIIESLAYEIEKLGLKIVKGSDLERREDRLNECLAHIKRNLVVDYGEFGMHLPDADIVIYEPKTCKVLCIVSSKATLRERITQTGYWFLKLKGSKITRNIKVFFITLDEDGDLIYKVPAKKGRAIVEVDTDGAFVITNRNIEESKKVKKFEHFTEELRSIIQRKDHNP
ncbi:MAG: BsaWI family type II restriction enzyme [Aquificaceae bacterium]